MKGLDMAKPKKPVAKAKEFAFEKGDFVVYPTHGVGRVIDIEAKEIAGHKLDLFVISFEQERMMLRVPVAKAKISGRVARLYCLSSVVVASGTPPNMSCNM